MNIRGTTDMNQENIRKLKKEAYSLEALVRIGKSGLKDTIIDEVNKLLAKRSMVKIKFLQSFLENFDKKEISRTIVERTRSTLVLTIGNTIVLHRKGKAKRL